MADDPRPRTYRIVQDNMHDDDVDKTVEQFVGTEAQVCSYAGDVWNEHYAHTANRGWRVQVFHGGDAIFSIDGEDDGGDD